MANAQASDTDELHKQIKEAAQNLFSLLARHTSNPTASTASTASTVSTSNRVDVDTPSQSLPGPVFGGGRGANLLPGANRNLVPDVGRGRLSVLEEMERSFPYYGKRRKVVPGRKPSPSSKIQPVKYIRLQVLLMAEPTDRTPRTKQETQLLEAGLGRRTIHIPERAEYEEIVGLLEDIYPKLKLLSGGWLFYKATGGSGQRMLSVVPSETEGYNATSLKAATTNGKNILYIVPLQDSLDTSPLPHTSPEFSRMPKSICKTCGKTMPLPFLPMHIEQCMEEISEEDSIQEKAEEASQAWDVEKVRCPTCGKEFFKASIEHHASSCGDLLIIDADEKEGSLEGGLIGAVAAVGTSAVQRGGDGAASSTEEVASGPSRSITEPAPEWMLTECPQRAAVLFKRSILAREVNSEPLKFSLDLRQSVEDRERAIICFYKANTTNWARPLQFWLEGDAAIGEGVNHHVLNLNVNTLQNGFHVNYGNGDVTLLFEGQQDHLVPCASQLLLDSDIFLMAGRILGHSFLHGGPVLAGLCPAVVCVLLGDKPDATTITLDDIPDMDMRKTIASLEGPAELSEEEQRAIRELSESWEIGRQFLTEETRLWLFHRLLQHAVLGRTAQQIVQFRKGIKQTGVWPLLSTKRATARLMFPRMADVAITPEMILDRIIWPAEKSMEDEEDEPYSLERRCIITGYLRQFIETASPKSLRALLSFWTGWEVPTEELRVEVVHGSHPRSSTCLQSLKLPGNYESYNNFSLSLESSISTCDTGFGLV